MKKNYISGFLVAAIDAHMNPKRSLSSALMLGFSAVTTYAGVANGNTSAAYLSGIYGLACAVNLCRHFQGATEVFDRENLPTSTIATLTATAPVAIAMDVLSTQSYSDEKVMSVAGLSVITVGAALMLKNRIWPERSNQSSIENTPS